MHERDKRLGDVQGCVKWNLVDVVDDHVETASAAQLRVRTWHDEIERAPAPAAENFNAVHHFPRTATRELRRQQRYPVAALHQTSENLVKVNLRPAGQRIPDVLPVDHQQIEPSGGHGRTASRARSAGFGTPSLSTVAGLRAITPMSRYV